MAAGGHVRSNAIDWLKAMSHSYAALHDFHIAQGSPLGLREGANPLGGTVESRLHVCWNRFVGCTPVFARYGPRRWIAEFPSEFVEGSIALGDHALDDARYVGKSGGLA